MKSIKILRVAILLLVCLNLFLLAQLYNQPKHPPRLSHIVKAEGAQAQKLDKEMRRHHRIVVGLTQKQVALRQKLARTQTKDLYKRSALLDQISQCQRKIDSITIAHFDRVNELCSPAQVKRFKKFQAKILEPLQPKR